MRAAHLHSAAAGSHNTAPILNRSRLARNAIKHANYEHRQAQTGAAYHWLRSLTRTLNGHSSYRRRCAMCNARCANIRNRRCCLCSGASSRRSAVSGSELGVWFRIQIALACATLRRSQRPSTVDHTRMQTDEHKHVRPRQPREPLTHLPL